MTEVPRGRVDLRLHAEEIAQAGARAPSHHNAQPWAFRVQAGAVEVYANRSRRIPVADPEDRQLFLGVGAAVYGVRLALAVLGLRPVVRLVRDDARPDLAAVVTASGHADSAKAADPAEAADRADPTEAAETVRRHAELSRRQTVRGPFTDDPLPSPLPAALTREVDQEGAVLYWAVREESRRDLAALVAEADRELRADQALRAELVRWVGPGAVRRGVGIPLTSLGRASAPTGTDWGSGCGISAEATRTWARPPTERKPIPGSPSCRLRRTSGRTGYRPARRCTGSCWRPAPPASRPPTSTSRWRCRGSGRSSGVSLAYPATRSSCCAWGALGTRYRRRPPAFPVSDVLLA